MDVNSARLVRSRHGVFGERLGLPPQQIFYGLFNSLQVALFAVLGVSGISAAQIGLVLTYTSMCTRYLCAL